MTRILAAVLVAVAGLLAAPHAAADPQDLLPYCSGDQTPIDNNCRPMAHQEFTHTPGGFDPNLSSGLDPGNPAIVG
ncbi:hypothetical protein [Mycobacterium sp. 1164985.4]|uniref:hypothetical protein n=1 Tax=Mycobacterium sp. 1164985.4 TaxID=1834069 RepID=UPI0007FDB51A|nr:hypothetical protein [Mycobacterium sp. 1164985.4]OBK77505.1 hypothetical protein A5650_13750 [Mycobacterium sp. 1164985.4]